MNEGDIETWLREELADHGRRLIVIETTLKVVWIALPTVFSLIGLTVVLLANAR